MELLSMDSKFFNTTWHDSQLLFSYQSFSRTFLMRHCPKISQACERDFSLLDSSATHSPFRNNRLLSILRYRAVHIAEILGLWSWFWCRGRINPLVAHISYAVVQDYGVCVCFLSNEECFLEIGEFACWVFYSKSLPYSSSFPTNSLNIFLAPLQ